MLHRPLAIGHCVNRLCNAKYNIISSIQLTANQSAQVRLFAFGFEQAIKIIAQMDSGKKHLRWIFRMQNEPTRVLLLIQFESIVVWTFARLPVCRQSVSNEWQCVCGRVARTFKIHILPTYVCVYVMYVPCTIQCSMLVLEYLFEVATCERPPSISPMTGNFGDELNVRNETASVLNSDEQPTWSNSISSLILDFCSHIIVSHVSSIFILPVPIEEMLTLAASLKVHCMIL